MKKTDQDKSDFDVEMQRDPIVNLYRKILVNPELSKPSARVLEIFRRLTRQRSKHASGLKNSILSIFDFVRPASIGWGIPVSLTLGIIVGVVVAPLWQPDSRPDYSFTDHPVSGFRSGETLTDAATSESSEEIVQPARTPEKWLEEIAKLIYEGKILQADAQLRKFKSQYPDYQKNDD